MKFEEIKKNLKRKTTDELIEIIEKLAYSTPSLIPLLEDCLFNPQKKPIVDIWEITTRIEDAIAGPLNYNHVWSVVDKLEDVAKTSQMLIESKNFTLAAEIWYLIVEGCVTAYNRGADDSSGTLGDFTIECISYFNKCMAQIQDQEVKAEYIDKVLDLYLEEDYGLDVEQMFEHIVDRENLKHIKEVFDDFLRSSKSKYMHEKMTTTLKDLIKIIHQREKRSKI